MLEKSTSLILDIDILAQLLQVDLGPPEIDMVSYLLSLAERVLNDPALDSST